MTEMMRLDVALFKSDSMDPGVGELVEMAQVQALDDGIWQSAMDGVQKYIDERKYAPTKEDWDFLKMQMEAWKEQAGIEENAHKAIHYANVLGLIHQIEEEGQE